MKWYTLEERPLKEGDQGLFYMVYEAFTYCSIHYEDNKFILMQDAFCAEGCENVEETDIDLVKLWMPFDELYKTLPKDKI